MLCISISEGGAGMIQWRYSYRSLYGKRLMRIVRERLKR